jgi:hypothetical protein
MSQPLTPSELAAFRARQKSRSRALALVLVALVVLFYAITLVKLKTDRPASGRPVPSSTGLPITGTAGAH